MADATLQARWWMAEALDEARRAFCSGEVPVGAVVVHEGAIIARAHNRRECDRDPLAHAEMLVIRRAAQYLQRWRLYDCTLVVTLEPCPMCAGAIVSARLPVVIFGAADPRSGAAGSVINVLEHPALNHRPQVMNGVCAEASGTLLKRFFAARRRGRGLGVGCALP